MQQQNSKRKNQYRSYDPNLKSLVSKTGDISYALRKGVPRTTAIYWAQKAKVPVSVNEKSILREQVQKLEQLLQVEKAKLQFISNLSSELEFIKNKKRKIPQKIKKKLVSEVEKYKKYCPVNTLVSLIGLHISRYYKWKSEQSFCSITKKFSCAVKRVNQLTESEVLKILKLAISIKYRHFSLTALWKFSVKHAIVVCSRDTWFKYINMLQLHRKVFKYKKTKYKHGIRATRPNEKWHLDLTEFELENGKKVYLQAIIDNYSRFIVDFLISEDKKSQNTATLIKSAKMELKANSKCKLITDLGSENNNKAVNKLLLGSNVEQIFARKDIRYSNSMIEAFFRSLKNNFLYYQKISTVRDFKRQVNFYIKEYNTVIPHSCFSLETPFEIYNNSWKESHWDNIKKIKKEALESRKNLNSKLVKCKSCLL